MYSRWLLEIMQVISAGIGMSLHLVERIAGRGLAEATARQMEFDWQEV
jgi:transcriptional regulator GlxA family with amidase domain